MVPKRVVRLRRELPGILEDAANHFTDLAREVPYGLLEQLHEFDARFRAYDQQIRALGETSEPAGRLMRIEAIGPQTAIALVATVGDPHVFKNGRGFAAWLGITPRQHSTGGKGKGAWGRLRTGARPSAHASGAWRPSVLARRRQEGRCQERVGTAAEGAPVNVAAVALAAKHARFAWAILADGTEYRPAEPSAAAA